MTDWLWVLLGLNGAIFATGILRCWLMPERWKLRALEAELDYVEKQIVERRDY